MSDTPPRVFASSYMERAYDHPDVIANRLMERVPVHFDTLVGTGLSGTLIVPAVARMLGKHWLIVRKPGDGSHSNHIVEGTIGQRWLFVDDLIASGNTVKRVLGDLTRVERASMLSTQFVGAFLYGGISQFDDCARFR